MEAVCTELASSSMARATGVEVRAIEVTQHLAQAQALMLEHWRETESEFSAQPPAPVAEIYAALESAGVLLAYGAFTPEGELVGYAVAMLSPHLHYGFRYAQHDVLFVRADHRRGSLALRLMRAVENAARFNGARLVSWHAKPASTMHDLLERLGYVERDIVYTKEL